MGIRIEVKQKETTDVDSLKMGDTFQTIKERDLYLVCEEDDVDGESMISVVNLSTGRIENINGFGAVLPVDLILIEE